MSSSLPTSLRRLHGPSSSSSTGMNVQSTTVRVLVLLLVCVRRSDPTAYSVPTVFVDCVATCYTGMYTSQRATCHPLLPLPCAPPTLLSLSEVSVDGSPLNCCEAIRTMAAQHRCTHTHTHTHAHMQFEFCVFLHEVRSYHHTDTHTHTHTHTHHTALSLHTQCKLQFMPAYVSVHACISESATSYKKTHSPSSLSLLSLPSSVSFLDLSPSSLSPMAFRLSSLSLPSHLLCRQEVQTVLKEACFLHCLEEMELKGITNPSVVGGRVCGVCVCVCVYGHGSLCVQLAWGL